MRQIVATMGGAAAGFLAGLAFLGLVMDPWERRVDPTGYNHAYGLEALGALAAFCTGGDVLGAFLAARQEDS